MIPRTLEPEVMDSAQEARDYDSMDHAAVNRAFVDDFLIAAGKAGLSLDDGEILDLGTGTAQIPIELCRRAPQARVIGVDLADEMLKLGRLNVQAAGFADRIKLELADGKRLPFADQAFADVISNSIVHHIPEPRSVLIEAMRVVRRAGVVFFRDLLRPADDAEVRRLVDIYAAGANDHRRALFDASLRAAFDLQEIRGIVASLGLDPQAVQATSDRHWTWAARR